MQKLAFIRSRGYGQRLWSGARWYTPGPALEASLLDQPEYTMPSRVTWNTPNGTFVPTPAPHAPANLASLHMTNPIVFQSYFRVHWEDMFGASANLAEGARRVPFRGSPFAPGSAEGQALQSYNPFPSAGELYPKVI